MEKKNEKVFLVLKIIAFESETTNSHNPKQDTCHWQSVYYETPPRFKIWLRETFSKSGSVRVMKKSDKNAVMQILQEFGTFLHVDCERLLCKGVFRRVVYTSLWQSVISEKKWLWRWSFFSKCLKFDVDSRNGTRKSEQIFSFKDNSIWIGGNKFSQYRKRYLSLAVNVLRNMPKI